ncbi:NERD domain-containing protein [Cryobacterium sp. 1639]|uniref:nuclease-related domain-containing protein n=1 Tax=Cryobacterium inferilacus TaxID=2866629 RepID=UPI001C737609|nr:nuclease-related domain-containing protein [Cryobacterium sp. 1639]MBX0301269.1 NERD domain-containing protein [Cryobacterium sp. 1639]
MTLNPPAMRTRIAAQLVIEHLLSRQNAVPPRTRVARLFGQSPLCPESVSWYLGAQGEITVGKLLATLPPDWTAFHAVPIGKNDTDIDHILVGPGGIFTINTQHHCGKRIWVGSRTVTVSGHKKAYLPAAEHEAERVSTVLRERMPLVAPVQPVVALVDAKQITFRQKPEQVKVLDARGLLSWLERLQPVLSEAEIAEAVVILDSPTTWRQHPCPPAADVMSRFTALDGQVRRARLRRVLWATAGVLSVGGGAVGAAALIEKALLGALNG